MADFLSMFKSEASKFNSRVTELRKALEQKRQQRERLASKPRSKADALKMLSDMLDDQAKMYPTNLRLMLQGVIEKPMDDSKTFAHRLRNFSVLMPTRNPDHGPGPSALQASLTFLFRDQIKAGLKDAINRMEWPADAGPDSDARNAEIKELDTAIDALESELQELEDQRNAMRSAI